MENFPNGIVDGFSQKWAIFPFFLSYAKQARKISSMMFQKEKTPFQALKTRGSKSQENGNFPKWLVRGFGLKL